MASRLETVRSIAERIHPDCKISYRPMFGEYALYANGKIVGLVADDRLFIKSTAEGKRFAGDFVEASPYPGAKPSLLITERIDDSEWLSELVAITERSLPAPKPKKKRS